MKKYKLLKDSPEADAGTIFNNTCPGLYEYQSKKKETCCVYERYVENNPEWFVEVKEEEIDKDYFVSRLAWLLVNKIHNGGMPDDLWKRRQSFIDFFKAEIPRTRGAGLFFQYNGKSPDEVAFDNKVYVLKEKYVWTDEDMIRIIHLTIDMKDGNYSPSMVLEAYKERIECNYYNK